MNSGKEFHNTLLVDVGNSRVKWNTGIGLHQAQASQAFDWHHTDPAEYIEQHWSQLPCDPVWISCVAGDALVSVLQEWGKSSGKPLHFARTQEKFNEITNAYQEAEQLGVDRWMALLGAGPVAQGISGQERNDVCIIDCGTAISVDVLEAGGQHRGGLIAPGLELMRHSLQLAPGVSINRDFDVNLLARNTTDGVGNGTLNMAVAFIQNTVLRIEEQYQRSLVKIITGGTGEQLKEHLNSDFHYDADLVLRGLARLANQSSI
ncbi:MAG: type III pantothenate kinase [Gammaproteobacteria bacterium]|nr:type III pantothenate kinase [Gammaproteobacteria bacterium]MDH5803393.1 type III pantothenate kinase [Gammaproteobacteria bacterium]